MLIIIKLKMKSLVKNAEQLMRLDSTLNNPFQKIKLTMFAMLAKSLILIYGQIGDLNQFL